MPINQNFSAQLMGTLLLAGFAGKTYAVECTDYAKRSVAQQEQNVFNLCGFRGSNWSNDFQRWNRECQSMSSKDVQSRLTMRDRFLSNCPTLNYAGVGRNRQNKLSLALLRATEKQDIRLVETLIKEGANLAVQPPWLLSSPLYIATMKNDLKLARLLVKHGAKPYFLAKGEESLLSLLIKQKDTNYAFLEFLLQNKANPNVAANGKEAEFPIAIAAMMGDFRAVSLLLAYKADPNRYIDRPAIQMAVEQDHYPIVRILIKYGANPNLGMDGKVCFGTMALDLAFRNARDRVIDLLLDNHALSSRECKAQK